MLEEHGDRGQGEPYALTNVLVPFPGDAMRVNCRRDAERPERARIDLIDDGPGIPKTIQPHVFHLFLTSRANGNGIGLASVKRTVEYHGGQAAVVPATGTGTHIEIILPLADSR